MIQRVAVVGAGTMGAGIAQLCAQSGFSVKVHDAFPAALESLPKKLRSSLDAAVLKGRLTTQQADRAYHSVSPAATLEDLAGADLVIEAAIEDLPAKKALFAKLDRLCPDAVLATNTSSLSVEAIASAVSTPHRVLGLHFFNPPVAMKLVELIRAPKTSPEVFQAVWEFSLAGLRRTPVDCKDRPGFIVNRVMRPFYVLSQTILGAHAFSIEEFDAAARAFGAPMGPCELLDLIGLDVNLAITKSIYEALGRPARFTPPAVQEKLVAQGCHGRKTGKGYYLYEGGKKGAVNPALAALRGAGKLSAAEAFGLVAAAVRAEAELVLQEGTAGKTDIDTAIKLAMNFPKGPFEWPVNAKP